MPASRTLALVLAGSLLACDELRSADPVVLAHQGLVVRRSEFVRHLAALEARDGPLAPEVRRSLFEAFVEERLLALEARARGLVGADASPEEERQAVQKLLAESVLEAVRVSDAEIARYYEERRQEFEAPETVALRQILVATENEARDMLRRLQKDPRSFETLARTHSRGPEAGSGGLMGVFARGQLPPELEQAAFAAHGGGRPEIVRTAWGYHVLKVDAREAPRSLSLEESRAEIRARLARERSDAAVRAFVQKLIAKAKVNYEAAEARTPSP